MTRRVLVPLDGSDLAAAIIPDARRLAGPEGVLLLVREASVASRHRERLNAEASLTYLETVAAELRTQGVSVDTQILDMGDAALGIDEAARILRADMVAIATHGRNLAERFLWGGVAWRALAHSPVPVLLRHMQMREERTSRDEPVQRHILVPLDGSMLAEKALPLADVLAEEWQAVITLMQVIPDFAGSSFVETAAMPYYYDNTQDIEAARDYLDRIRAGLHTPVDVSVLTGPTLEVIVGVAHERPITDIVLASHGRTGLPRVILGSVADALVRHLTCPIIVVPALAIGKGSTEADRKRAVAFPNWVADQSGRR